MAKAAILCVAMDDNQNAALMGPELHKLLKLIYFCHFDCWVCPNDLRVLIGFKPPSYRASYVDHLPKQAFVLLIRIFVYMLEKWLGNFFSPINLQGDLQN